MSRRGNKGEREKIKMGGRKRGMNLKYKIEL